MVKRSFSYNKVSKVHAQGTRRRIAKRTGLLLQCLGALLLLAGPIFLLLAHRADYRDRETLLRFAGVYLAAGIVAWFVGRWLRSRHRRHPPRPPAPDRSRTSVPSAPPREGSILVMVLVIVALLSGLAIAAQVEARYAHQAEDIRLQRLSLRLAGADAVRDALHRLADDEDRTIDHLDEPWAQTQEITDPSDISTLVTVIDENRFFDFNNLAVQTPPTLRPVASVAQDIMTLCGDFTPIGRIDALRDWVDSDPDGLLEAVAYQRRALLYEPPNRIVIGWNEILHVKDFSRDLFHRSRKRAINDPFHGNLIESMTFLPVARQRIIPVNVNTAREQTLYGVLGIGQDRLLTQILERRIIRPLREADTAALSIDPDLVQQLGAYLTVRSSYFRVTASTYRGGHSFRTEALVHRSREGDVEVLQWLF